MKSSIPVGKIWDVVVIGGGPAGMMAAGTAAERGKSVLILEKNPGLGKKLLITGGGRCNLTNHKPDLDVLISSYTDKPKPLYSLFFQFGVNHTLDFFNSHNLPTKVEAEDRVFPVSNQAESVWKVMVEYIKSNKVSIKLNSTVTGISADKTTGLIKIHTKAGYEQAKACVLATGGTSHPETGSTGDGFKWLKALGHSIIDNNFALVPLTLKNLWVKDLAGVTLQNIRISVVQNGKRQHSRKGKLLFTHLGVSGPTVLNMSSTVGDLLQYGEVQLELDLLPDLDFTQTKAELNSLLSLESNKKLKNTLGKLVPTSLVNVLLNLSKADGEKPNHSVSKQERTDLIKTIKSLALDVKGLLGADKAIVSAGGVKIEEVDFKTMESRIIPGLFLVGDVLNIDRPSGGYSLQLCWATGFVAGSKC
jgi:predicted Rossmann fold flavoprotein